ncbi:transcriptional antiterminator, Rof [Ectothiorhodospiraceae bacterium 2226]|nr:transcriptional antiterminator, Rof [Ectothiorhodospiraceae bacterium 2226]
MMIEQDVDGYVSMPCEQYAELELAIMHRERLRVAWRGDDGSSFVGLLDPRDLQTESGAEFLLGVLPDGKSVRLRLDHILGFERV